MCLPENDTCGFLHTCYTMCLLENDTYGFLQFSKSKKQ